MSRSSIAEPDVRFSVYHNLDMRNLKILQPRSRYAAQYIVFTSSLTCMFRKKLDLQASDYYKLLLAMVDLIFLTICRTLSSSITAAPQALNEAITLLQESPAYKAPPPAGSQSALTTSLLLASGSGKQSVRGRRAASARKCTLPVLICAV